MQSGRKYKVPMCGIAQHLSHLETRNYYHSIRLVKTNPTSCVSSFYDHWVVRYTTKCIFFYFVVYIQIFA